MVKVVQKVPIRTYKTMRTVFLFSLGAVLVLFSVFLPKMFGERQAFGIQGGGIASADAPSCGGDGGDGRDGGGDGGDGGVGGGDGGGCDSSDGVGS